MNEDELVAYLFGINQTKQKLIRDNVQGEKEAKDVHYEVLVKGEKAICGYCWNDAGRYANA